MFLPNKRAALSMLQGIILMLVVLIILLASIKLFASQAEGPASEGVCKTFNEFNVGLLPGWVREVKVRLEGCRTIEKDDIPSGSYALLDSDKGAKKQIADMTAKCWNMWLEGARTKEGGNEDVLEPVGSNDNDCFICYTFRLKSGNEISAGDLGAFMASQAYKVEDTSDRCASFENGGGKCMSKCEGEFSYETKSNLCKTGGQKCCVSADPKNICVNKGGECILSNNFKIEKDGKMLVKYDSWLCGNAGGTCYIDARNFQSYVDYIQSGGNGPGILSLSKSITEDRLEPGVVYAVVFNEDTTAEFTQHVIGASVVGAAGFVGGAAAGAYAVAAIGAPINAIPGVGTAVYVVAIGVGAGVGALVGWFTTDAISETGEALGAVKDRDMILVTGLDELNKGRAKCSISSGANG